MVKKRVWGLGIAALLLAAALLWAAADPERGPMLMGAGVLGASVSLWICGTFPMSVTTLLMIAALGWMGILSFQSAMAQISTSTSLFILASSGLTVAVQGSGLTRRATHALTRRFGANSRRLLFGLGMLITVSSAFMSSLATCAMYTALLMELLNSGGAAESPRFRRDVYLMIPACAGIGGFMSPAGTPANVLLLDLLASHGIKVSFLQWCAVGMPVGLGASALFLAALLLILPPERISLRSSDAREPLSRRDRTLGCILLLVICGWLTCGWLPHMDVTMVALLGMGLMFLPGVDILDWKKLTARTDWDLVIMMGTVSVLMGGIASTGLLSRVADFGLRALAGLPPYVFLALLSVALFLLRTCIPTTTAAVALLSPLLMEIAAARGMPVMTPVMLLAFWTAAALILVYTEPIYLMTFRGGQAYRATDLARVGAPVSLALAFLLAAALPPLVRAVFGVG